MQIFEIDTRDPVQYLRIFLCTSDVLFYFYKDFKFQHRNCFQLIKMCCIVF